MGAAVQAQEIEKVDKFPSGYINGVYMSEAKYKTIAFEGLNILGVETCLFQRYDLAERRAIDHKEGISLPNFFYRLDF